jgi:hypothetical protein
MLKNLALTLAVMAPLATPCFGQVVEEAGRGQPRSFPAAGDVTIELYGSVQIDGIYDFNRVDPDWVGGFRPSKIPTTDGAFGEDGQANFSVRQTLFGISGAAPVADKTLKASFEFDLFGQGSSTGETTFHLQRASVEWGPLMFGYDKTLLMDPDLFPNIIDYWGPSGMIYVKNPGIRYTFVNSDTLLLAAALELPGNDVDPGRIRILDPALGANLTSTQKVPDLTLAGRISGDWGHLRLAGVARRVGFETAGSPGGDPHGGEFGWGLNLTSNVKLGKATTIRAGGVYGHGIASYFNDGGTDLAPKLNPGLSGEAKAAEIYGLMLYVDHAWNDQFATSLGASRTTLENTNFQSGDAFHTGDYASVNLTYKPIKNLLVGTEVLYGRRKDKNGNAGEDTRVQVSLRYSYGVTLMGRR